MSGIVKEKRCEKKRKRNVVRMIKVKRYTYTILLYNIHCYYYYHYYYIVSFSLLSATLRSSFEIILCRGCHIQMIFKIVYNRWTNNRDEMKWNLKEKITWSNVHPSIELAFSCASQFEPVLFYQTDSFASYTITMHQVLLSYNRLPTGKP